METNNHPSWIVPLEISRKLKDLGFNEPCIFLVNILKKVVGEFQYPIEVCGTPLKINIK